MQTAQHCLAKDSMYNTLILYRNNITANHGAKEFVGKLRAQHTGSA